MKKTILLLGLVLFSLNLFAQGNRPPGPQPCEDFPANIDSVLFMSWNTGTSSWSLATIRPYKYKQNKLAKFFTVIPGTRDTTQKWEYYYNSQGFRDFQLYSTWSGTEWVPVQKTETVFDNEGRQLNQLLSDWRNNEWVFRLFYIFEYENGIRTRHIWQAKDSQGNLFDFWHYYYSYSNGNLSELFVVRVSDNYPIRKDVYAYDTKGRVAEVIRLQPKNRHTTELSNFSRRTYTYDQFGLLREVLFENWQNNQWVNATRHLYHYRIDNATRVRMCVKGKPQCVPKNLVPKRLSEGATLGACPGTSTTTSTTRTQSATPLAANLKSLETVKVYPNPASEAMTVVAGESFTRVDLLNSNGQIIQSFSLVNSDHTVIERNGLPSGIYFLRFVGQEEVKTEKVIFR